jgi:aminocarboxymuconate-semialdehyde decarboxylase
VIVDAHAHVIPPEALRAPGAEAAAPDDEWRPSRVGRTEAGASILAVGSVPMQNVRHEFVDADAILAELSGLGVEGAVLAPHVGLLRYGAPADQCLASSRVQNDAIAAIASRHPGRVAGLGTVPMQDPALAVGELERLVEAGLKGIEVGANVGGVFLGDRRFRVVWEACQALDAVVFIHPLGMPSLREHYMTNVVGNPVDTAIAAAHLVLSGTMEDCPRLRVLLAHGGGVLPSLRGRLDHGARVRPEIDLPRPPSEYLRRFYYDTITHDPTLLRELVGFVGADHVLLGSDYPFDMGTDDAVGEVRAAGLEADQERLVLGDSAAALFGL